MDLPLPLPPHMLTQQVHNSGFVRFVDHLGSDDSVVQAARVSYGNVKKNTDVALLRRLMRHRHTSPFEMCELVVDLQMPIFIARQWIRHRTASLNEISGRYSEMADEFFIPEEWRAQSQTNKQGSSDVSIPYGYPIDIPRLAYDEYERRIAAGISKEQARIDLPLSLYTRFRWKIDLHNLFHFLGLRMDSHAQKETRDYANAIGKIVKILWPISWQAFVDYRLEAMTLTRLDILVMQRYGIDAEPDEVESVIENKTEREEFYTKMAKISRRDAQTMDLMSA